jgi:ketosteroid isomerase-like protein
MPAVEVSPNVAVVQRLWEAFDRGGIRAALELAPAAEWAPHVGGGQTFRNRDEILAFFEAKAATGGRVEASAYSFEERGDCVLVHGRVRDCHPGRLAESQTYWVFEVRDGHMCRASAHRTRADAEAAVDALRPAPVPAR